MLESIDSDFGMILHAAYDLIHRKVKIVDQLKKDENIECTEGTIAPTVSARVFQNTAALMMMDRDYRAYMLSSKMTQWRQYVVS